MRWILSFSLIWILDSFLYGTSAATSSIWSIKISSGLLLRDSGKSSSLQEKIYESFEVSQWTISYLLGYNLAYFVCHPDANEFPRFLM